jgi:hypothetical protein
MEERNLYSTEVVRSLTQFGESVTQAIHDARRVGIAKAVLDGESVEGIGVVGGPDFISNAEDAKIYPAAPAGAEFNLHPRVFGAQLAEDTVEVFDVLDVNLLLLVIARSFMLALPGGRAHFQQVI